MTRVLIVDDQPRARRSLQALLTAMHLTGAGSEQDGGLVETIGEASDDQAAIDQVALLHPDVVILDLHLPGVEAATVITRIKSRWPEVRIVVLTMYANERAAVLEAGADAFLLKGCSTGELMAALMRNDGLS